MGCVLSPLTTALCFRKNAKMFYFKMLRHCFFIFRVGIGILKIKEFIFRSRYNMVITIIKIKLHYPLIIVTLTKNIRIPICKMLTAIFTDFAKKINFEQISKLESRSTVFHRDAKLLAWSRPAAPALTGPNENWPFAQQIAPFHSLHYHFVYQSCVEGVF